MRNTTSIGNKLSVNLAAAVKTVADHKPQALTLEELVRAYDATRNKTESERLRKWLSALGNLSAWEVTTEQLSAAAQAMVDAGYKPSSPNRDLSALGSVYRWAMERRICPRGFRSPTMGVTRFKEDFRRVFMTDEEIETLRSRCLAWKDRRFSVYVWLLFDTGARKSEISLRRWSDVDMERREIRLATSKNGKPRVLHFSEATKALILRVFPNRPEGGLIFEGKLPGSAINYKAAWRRLVEDIGRTDLRQHDSRHIVAAGMLRNGVTLVVAAQVLGNTTAVLDARYGHLETETLRKAVATQWTH